MPVTLVFRCEFCAERPDPETQRSLEQQVLDMRHGEYVDAEPGRWLTYYEGVVAAIRSGGATPPPVTAAEAIGVLEILEAARESARRGAVVAL